MIMGMMAAEANMTYRRESVRRIVKTVDPDGLASRTEAFQKRLVR